MKVNTMIKQPKDFSTKEEAIDYYFNYYKENGYPNYDKDDYNPFDELSKVIDTQSSEIIGEDNSLKQVMTGCGFLWTFFPHWIDTKTYNSKSVRESWNNDELLRKLIEKVYNYVMKHDNERWSTNRIRQCAKVYCASQAVSNFRPTVAKYIYNTYGNKGNVYDPCGGWGGRMFGFIASNCKEYECCEPSTKSYEGLLNLKNTYPYLKKTIKVNNLCAEDYVPKESHFDLAFTSPPYFNTEEYSTEDTQSYLRYPSYEEWKEGFLKRMIHNCHIGLKDNGILIINIANVSTAPTLEQDTVSLAMEEGFILKDTLKLILSSIAGKGIKYEPVFIFKKENIQ